MHMYTGGGLCLEQYISWQYIVKIEQNVCGYV